MEHRGRLAVVLAILGIIATVIGGSASDWSFDFSQTTTNIGQIGDNIINNYIKNELGIDIEQYRANCETGVYDNDPAGQYCDLV